MQLSKGALDMIATCLSEFTEPDIPELSLRDDKTLENNMLACILGAFSGKTNAHVRHLMTDGVRRVFAFKELSEMITASNDFFYEVQSKALEKRQRLASG